MENSVNRNKVAHIHEVVYNLVHWFDDKIFRLYPTWEDCLGAGVFPYPQLEAFFGPEGNQHGKAEGAGGPGNYKQCAERGIGRYVIAKMLEGTASDEDIRKALENLPMSDQRRRYEEDQAEIQPACAGVPQRKASSGSGRLHSARVRRGATAPMPKSA